MGPQGTRYDPAVPWQRVIPFSAIPRDSIFDPVKPTLVRFTPLATRSPNPTSVLSTKKDVKIFLILYTTTSEMALGS